MSRLLKFPTKIHPYPSTPFRLRPATLALGILGSLVLGFMLTFADAAWHSSTADQATRRALVRELGLTDLSLFTEARYTRHPSQADIHTPFQDHPGALEHFPSGALMSPPPNLKPYSD